jgi:MYXO-CTERM domain-containing protein
VFSATDLTTAFHVFGLDWEADRIVWYADGQQIGRITYPGQLHDMEMYLIANLAVGGDLPGNPSPSAIFPASYDIDYIRVYQRDGSDPDAAPPFGPALTIAASSVVDGGPPCGDAGTDPSDGATRDAFDTDAGDMEATDMDAPSVGATDMDAADVSAVDATASGSDASTDAGVSPSTHSGCGCATAGRSRGSRFAFPAGLAFLMLALRRRFGRAGS